MAKLFWPCLAGVLLAALGPPHSLAASEPSDKAAAPEAPAAAPAPPGPNTRPTPGQSAGRDNDGALTLPADLQDPAFDRYVDVRLIGPAVRSRDAAQLADVGLQLAEGERVLLRTHKSGITAHGVLQRAVRLAADQHDKATLDRLARAAEKSGDKDLLAQAQDAQKPGEVAREVGAALRVPVDDVSPEQFALLKELSGQVRSAELIGDAEGLKAAEERLGQADLPAAQKEALKKQVARAREALPKESTPESKAIRKVAEVTRGFGGISLPDVQIPQPGPIQLPGGLPDVRIPTHLPGGLPDVGGSLGGYETNKFDLEKGVENGGWVAAWADDISETDVAEGLVSVGVSIYTANPAPFYAWIQNLIDRTLDSLGSDVRQRFPGALLDQAKVLAANAIKAAIQGQSAQEVFRQFDTVDFKAGAIRYSGRNYGINPVTGAKFTVSTTWGMKPYVAFRWRGSGGGSGGQAPGGGGPGVGPGFVPGGHPSGGGPVARQTKAVYAQNNTPFPIWVAAHYQLEGQWRTDGFYEVQPHQRRLICHTDNRYVYFYANGPGRQVKWAGPSVWVAQGEQYGFFSEDTGATGGDFTMQFNYTAR